MDKAMNRQRVLLQHLRTNSSVSSFNYEFAPLSASICAAGDSAAYHRTAAFGDDVVIVAAYRTAICKAKRGGFKDTLPDDLLAPVLKEIIERTNLNPSEVGDIVVGTVRAPGSLRATECRMAAFYGGFPDCIGSAFNIKGAMQCPNCRKIKKGQWLYSNGCCSFPELNMEDWTHDEDLYDLSYSEMIMAAGVVGRLKLFWV